MYNIKNPDKYCIYILRDDFTPQEFIKKILTFIFYKNDNEIQTILKLISTDGKAPVDIYIKEIALVKQKQVERNAKNYGFPLKIIIEPFGIN